MYFTNIFKNIGWLFGLLLASSVSIIASYSAEWIGEDVLGFNRSPISDIMMAIVINKGATWRGNCA